MPFDSTVNVQQKLLSPCAFNNIFLLNIRKVKNLK